MGKGFVTLKGGAPLPLETMWARVSTWEAKPFILPIELLNRVGNNLSLLPQALRGFSISPSPILFQEMSLVIDEDSRVQALERI